MANNRTPPIAWIFFFLMVVAFSSGNFSAVLWLVFVGVILSGLFGISIALMRSVFGSSNARTPRSQRGRQAQPVRPSPQAVARGGDDLRPHAVPREVARRALQRAGSQPNDWLLSLEDIGLLAYHGDNSPDVVRLNPVAADTTHLRPFVVIYLPYKQGRGTITFELFDEFGTRCFVAREQHSLTQGPNFVTPRTYLPLPTERTGGVWALRVSIGDRLLAEHVFPVHARLSMPVRNLLAEDGEVDPWLARAITEQGMQKSGLSLDELLAGQLDGRESDSRLR
jgi:hypothetical protein